jgi:hypothetical protein
LPLQKRKVKIISLNIEIQFSYAPNVFQKALSAMRLPRYWANWAVPVFFWRLEKPTFALMEQVPLWKQFAKTVADAGYGSVLPFESGNCKTRTIASARVDLPGRQDVVCGRVLALITAHRGFIRRKPAYLNVLDSCAWPIGAGC